MGFVESVVSAVLFALILAIVILWNGEVQYKRTRDALRDELEQIASDAEKTKHTGVKS